MTITKELTTVFGCIVQPLLLNDSKFLFEIIFKGGRTSKCRLKSDLASSREAFDIGEISTIGLMRSEKSLTDGMAKMICLAALKDMLLKETTLYMSCRPFSRTVL